MWIRFAKSPVLPGVLAALILVRLLSQGLSWTGVAALVIVIGWFGISLIHRIVNRPIAAPPPILMDEREDFLISLVYLLEEPREATEETVRQCVSNALELKIDSDDPNATEFVITASQPGLQPPGQVQQFIIRIPQGVFGVIVSSEPYVDDPHQYAYQSIRDKRLRTAIEKHQAWISVDLMGGLPPEEEKRTAYDIIGRILASMAGPDCLALYCPELQRCNEFDPSLIEQLGGGDPLSLFEEPTFEPVIEISEDDPRMVRAVEDAVLHWPEFVEAFQARDDLEDERFIVKAEFSENGRSEFMWVSVTRVNGDHITGILMNDPHELVGIYRGQEVDIRTKQLNDWLYPSEDGDAVGGFTLKILADEPDSDDQEKDEENPP